MRSQPAKLDSPIPVIFILPCLLYGALFVLPRLWFHTYRRLRQELIERRTAIEWATVWIWHGDLWIETTLKLRFQRYMAIAFGPDDESSMDDLSELDCL
jgi:hypothetical protein